MSFSFHAFRFVVFLCLASLIITACSSLKDDDDSTDVETLVVTPDNLVITKIDSNVELLVQALNSKNQTVVLSGSIQWSSSDESLATVDTTGIVTAIAPGKVIISATYGDITDSIQLEINESGLSIQGKVRYEDKKYDANGFIESPPVNFKNVRYATIDLLDANDNIMASTSTDAQGEFNFGFFMSVEYHLRVLTEVAVNPAPGFVVKDMGKRIYAVTTDLSSGETSHEIDVTQDINAAGAFNILDVIVSAAEYSRDELQLDIKNLSVFWEINSVYGTYYCSGSDAIDCINGKGIYVLSLPNVDDPDSDEYDDDVILHEFGHYILGGYFIDDSPAGCHFITTNDSDLSLAWSEGWGTFFGSSVKSWLSDPNIPEDEQLVSSIAPPTSYVDTDGEVAFLSYDIQNPVFGSEPEESFFYASSETAVSKILWSVRGSFEMEKVRDVLVNYFPQSSEPTNLPNFWRGLLTSTLYDSAQLAELNSIFAERKVFYQEDDFELDDDIDSATVTQVNSGELPDHYLYKDNLGKDLDVFVFDVEANKKYSVATSNLRNGIDTYVRILDEDGSLVVLDGRSLENDDAKPGHAYRFDHDPSCLDYRFFNDASSLASTVEFVAPISGQYFVEVSHYSSDSSKFGAVGPYGSYQLAISETN